MLLQSAKRNHSRQWNPIRQRSIQGVLYVDRNKAVLRLSKTPSIQWPHRKSEQYNPPRHLKKITWQTQWKMGRGTHLSHMVTQYLRIEGNKIHPLQTPLRRRSHPPRRAHSQITKRDLRKRWNKHPQRRTVNKRPRRRTQMPSSQQPSLISS